MHGGILLGIIGIVATIIFGIVGALVIRNRHSQRQTATGAHSTAMQSGRDNIIIHGPATFNSKTPDAHSDELPIAIGTTILLGVISIFYFWDKTHPLELQQTILLGIAFPFIIALLVIVPILWILVFIKTRY
jgi:UDP-N-acetylmuramyl pentapeptide phosphotransferase/UDP-N-acetylglucosamine-1-phosphate transferase